MRYRSEGAGARLCLVGLVAALVLTVGARAQPGGGAPAPAQAQGITGAAEMPKGAGFILGQVVDSSGQPVAGAVVMLTRYGALPGGVPGGPLANVPGTSANLTASAPHRVISDARGYYLFRDLAGGRYAVRVTARGYIGGGYLQVKPDGTQHLLDLGEGEKRGDVQLVVWKFAAITGTVVDDAGEPAVGVTVKSIKRSMLNGAPRLVWQGTGTTDDRGVYRISGLAPGDYIVGITTSQSTIPATLADAYTQAVGMADTVDAAAGMAAMSQFQGAYLPTTSSTGFRIGNLILQGAGVGRSGTVAPQPADDGKMLAVATTFFPGTAASSQAIVLTIGAGVERANIDLQLKLVPTVTVSGVVMGPDGPARNLPVKLLPPGVDDFATDAGVDTANTWTDAKGAFRFLGVPSGQYTLKVLKAPMATPGDARLPQTSVGPTFWATLPVTVEAADLNGLSLTLRTGIRVSGRVEFVGAKTRPSEEDLIRMNVTLSPLGARPSVPFPPGGHVTADGQFSTSGYPPGKYLVTPSAFAGWTLQSVKHGTSDVSDEPMVLDASDVTDVVVTYSDKSSQMTGPVSDAAGAPATSADIIVFPADSDTWRHDAFGLRRIRLQAMGKGGQYVIEGLPPGAYWVVAIKDSATTEWQDATYLEGLQASAVRVTIGTGEKVTQALKMIVVK